MFEKEKIYWFKHQTTRGEFTDKGSIIDEDSFFLKLKDNRDNIRIIAKKNINNVWEDKGETNV